jgi:RecB family exonuclease
VARAGELVAGWISSPLWAELGAPHTRLRPEAAFVLSVGGTVVRGKIDLVAEPPGGELVVVDYKTDALGDDTPESHAARYATQRGLYALAASEALGRSANGAGEPPRVRTVYCFLERPDEPVERTFAQEELEAARAEVEALAAGVRAGRFEVTEHPHRALCHDCPARERLCSYGPERTMAVIDR